MKILLLLTLFTVSISFAKKTKIDKLYLKSLEHFKNKDYFTALDLIAHEYKYVTPDQNIQHYIEQLVGHTGTHYFNTFSDLELRKINIPTTVIYV